MKTEVIYLGHNNSVDLLLKADASAVSLTGVSKITLAVGDTTTVTSLNGAAATIRWEQAGYATGEVRLFLGGLSLTAGAHTAYLTVYDAVNTDGIVWGSLPISIVSEVEV